MFMEYILFRASNVENLTLTKRALSNLERAYLTVRDGSNVSCTSSFCVNSSLYSKTFNTNFALGGSLQIPSNSCSHAPTI